jgi:opacity protein-like surface antigen
MFKRYAVIIVVVLVVKYPSCVYGQIERNKNSIFRVDRTELGVGAGTTFYLGDYNEYLPLMSPSYYGSVMHRFNFNLLYSLRTSISFGNIAGNSRLYKGDMPFYDLKYPYGRPAIHFNRNFIDLNTGVEFGFSPLDPVEHNLNEKFAPYIFLGIGISIVYTDSNAKTDDARSASLLYPKIYGDNETSSSSSQIFNIPIGLGFKYSPWKRWTIGVEWQFKKTFNDDIDRFNNINPSIINNNKKGSVLSNTDWISLLGVNIAYRLAVKSKCPSIKKNSPSKRLLQGINRDYDLHDNKKPPKKSKITKN